MEKKKHRSIFQQLKQKHKCNKNVKKIFVLQKFINFLIILRLVYLISRDIKHANFLIKSNYIIPSQ